MCILRQYRRRCTLIILQDCNMLMFNPNNVSCDCSWFRSRSEHVLTTNEPHQSLFVTRPRPPLQERLSLVVVVRTQVRLLCSHLPKRTAFRGQTNLRSIELNQTGQKKLPKIITGNVLSQSHRVNIFVQFPNSQGKSQVSLQYDIISVLWTTMRHLLMSQGFLPYDFISIQFRVPIQYMALSVNILNAIFLTAHHCLPGAGRLLMFECLRRRFSWMEMVT